MQATGEGYRLSAQQKHLWGLYNQRGGRGSCAWLAVEVRGELDPSLLRRAVGAVVERHEILRTAIRRVPELDLALQVIGDGEVAWEEDADWSGLSPAEVEARLRSRALEALADPLDLERDPLLRASLARVSAREHLLSLRLPALLADEYTLRELPGQIAGAYTALLAGATLPADPLQYADLAEWQNEVLESGGGVEGGTYWASRAAAVPPLPGGLAGPVHPDPGGFSPGLVALRLEPELVAALGRVAAPLSGLLLAALHVLLYRLTQHPETRVAVYFDGRGYEELGGALGPVGGYLPVDCRLAGDLTAAEVVDRVGRAVEEAREWQGSFSPERVQAGGIGFSWRDEPPRSSAGALSFALLDAAVFSEPFALSLACQPAEDGLLLKVFHDAERVPPAGAERFAEELHTLLHSLAARPDAAVDHLEVVGALEHTRLVREWNATERPDYPLEACLHELFQARAARHPDALAVSGAGGELTYAELNRRANRLARSLAERGVGPEVPVALCMERSPELLVAILAVLKAGGAYLPIDPALPEERARYQLSDAGARLVLARSGAALPVPAGPWEVFRIDADATELAALDDADPERRARPENLAYLIYTSGSTGRPKGVMVPHRGVVNYLSWCLDTYPLEEGGGALLHGSVAVDMSVTALFAPLLSGGAVVLLEPGAGVEELGTALRGGRRFSLVKLTPTHLQVVEPAASTGALIVGGEALHAESVSGWRAGAPGVRIVNEYGPTETVVGCCAYELGAGDPTRGAVPIGRPVTNTRVYVLDAGLRPVPVGVGGEVYVGGAQVARGYLGRADLTAERFLPDPFSAEPGGRVYRTGDLARHRADGELEYLGRADQQVKIRGYRVEPGEIEAALLEHPSVREAVVVAREDEPGQLRLVAYLVPAAEAAPGPGELRAFLLKRLPEYMVPGIFMVLDALPHTSSGKVDRRALPEPGPERPELDHAYVAPRNGVEEALVGIWADVLQLDEVGVRDDFFEIGGDSFKAVRLMSRIGKRFGRKLPLATLIQAGTIEKIADLLSARDDLRHDHLVPIQPGGSKPPLYCIHTGEGTVLCYRGLREVGPDQPVYAIQALDFDMDRRPLTDVGEMAARYVDLIVAFQPEGPYLLAGWSFGGIVAFEMARQLHLQGREVKHLVLFDCHHPVIGASMARIDPVLRRISLLFDLADLVRDGKPVVAAEELVGMSVKEQLALLSGRVGIPPHSLIPRHIDPDRLEDYLDLRMMRAQAIDEYTPGEYPGKGVTLFRARDLDLNVPFPEMREAFLRAARSADYGWGEVCREPVRVRTIPGTHETLFRESNVGGLVQELRLCLEGEDPVGG